MLGNGDMPFQYRSGGVGLSQPRQMGQQVTTKECGSIEESLYDEHLLGEKCLHWAAEVHDEQLQQQLQQIAQTCQTHFQQLTMLLQTPVLQ